MPTPREYLENLIKDKENELVHLQGELNGLRIALSSLIQLERGV